jgi:hypothetical protein
MGQQQLLLLVLSTVIVGLATVAGIQAFSENQAQASQDALVQRATSVVSDIQGLQGKPSQLGGIDLVSNTPGGATIARKMGLQGVGSSASGAYTFDVDGAGSGGQCKIEGPSGNNEATVTCKASDAPQDVEVTFTADDPTSGSDESAVSTNFGDSLF